MSEFATSAATGAEDGPRRARGERIARVDPALADLYSHACILVEQPISAISMSMLGHAMRELLNGLAEGLAKMEGIELPSRQDDRRQIDSLVEEWEAANLPTDESAAIAIGENALQAIPSAVYGAAQGVVRGQQQVTANSAEKMARIVSAAADVVVPAAKQLKKTYEFFMRWCHVKRGDPRPLPDAAEVVAAYAHVESVIDIRLAPFFVVKSDLDDILAATNQPIARANEENSNE